MSALNTEHERGRGTLGTAVVAAVGACELRVSAWLQLWAVVAAVVAAVVTADLYYCSWLRVCFLGTEDWFYKLGFFHCAGGVESVLYGKTTGNDPGEIACHGARRAAGRQ